VKVTVFGATGGVGREVIAQALDRGDHVTAYVRNPAKLDLTDPNLTVITGELTDREAVRRAVRGADAVVSALGPSLDRKATGMPLVDGTRAIVGAMQAEGVERYIGMATPSLRDPRDARSLLGLIVPFMGRTFLPRAYRELLAMSKLVTDSPSTGRSRASPAPPTAPAPAPSAPATSAATASAPASPAPTSQPSCSTRAPTPASTALRPPSATEGSIPQLPPDFRELRYGEVRRISLPRTPLNRGKRKGSGLRAAPAPLVARC